MGVIKNQNEIFEAGDGKPVKSLKRAAEKANQLDGREWLQNSISIWSDIRKTQEEQKLGHPAMFPVTLAIRLLRSFTRSDQKVVLDPFLGSGTTLLAAVSQGKGGYGFDISPDYINLAKTRLTSQRQLFHNNEPEVHAILGSASNLLEHVKENSVDICITSPPYWNILQQKRSADNKAGRDYDVMEGNLGNIDNYERFVRELGIVFESVNLALKANSYCIVNVMDIRKRAKFYALHSDLANEMERIGFIYDDLIIWDRRAEYNNLRPLGYPSVFRINRVHEYLLIFQKR